MILWNLLSSSAGLMYVVPIIGYLLTQKSYYIIGFAGLFGTLCIGEFLKHIVIQDRSPRPAGAEDCNLWCNDGAQAGRPGMPSTHSAQAIFFATFYSHYASRPWITFVLYGYAILVMLSRYIKQCHTLPQIITGAALGWGISWCVRYRA